MSEQLVPPTPGTGHSPASNGPASNGPASNGPASNGPASNGLATAGFVLGLIGLVLCLIPIVNNVAFPLAGLGLVFGVIGLLKARKGAPKKGLAIAAIVLSVLAGVGVFASQSFYGKVLDDVSDSLADTPTASTDDAGATDAGPAGDDEAAEPSTPEAGDDAAADDGAPSGTRQNPYPVGTQVTSTDWTITLGTPREAWGEIQAANQFNTAPDDGMEYWIVPLTGTFTGDQPSTPWVDLSVRFVGDDNVTYDGTCGVVPDSLIDVAELYAGAELSANACVAVPAGAPGLFTLRTSLFGDQVFFTR
ncbi:DUF4190 domain-containing protein [Xylanimonas allomyrinae]|uniref:DUF4190 domain-containing protein n=1 Tax=Xylanimonas allomyrinae TaxID=2509459 RepID=A0A4P6ELC0_9MICO|nr:DUF4190 domain-containing protein [Xylanimonas allomyrinae]QAY63454.1 DUF4190 domain-containing protein [Xylanimonas allomyrinae]